MRVAITGVAGFLGSHLADALLDAGHDVVGIDNLIGGYRDNVPNGVEFYAIDCRDEAVRSVLYGADVVYHCAATAYEGLSIFSPHFVTSNIVDASASVISAAIAGGVRRFVLCSSMARYGSNVTPFTEDMPTRPQDPYGIGKVAAEQLLVNLAGVHGMEYVIAVPHNIAGPRQRYDDPYRNVLSIMINRDLQGKPPIIYGDGDQVRCFSHVADDVPALVAMATASVSGEVINIGPDRGEVTINELARAVSNLEPIHALARPQEVRLASCSADKARRLLGFRADHDLTDIIRDTREYISKRGPRPFNYDLPIEIISPITPSVWRHRML